MSRLSLAGTMVAGIAVGAAGDASLRPSYDTQAAAHQIRLYDNGAISVGIVTKLGDCFSDRDLVVAPDGGARLNGQPATDADSIELARAAREIAAQARAIAKAGESQARMVRLHAEGPVAVLMEVPVDGGTKVAEALFAPDGGTTLNGKPMPDLPPEVREAGAVITANTARAKQRTSALAGKLVEPRAP